MNQLCTKDITIMRAKTWIELLSLSSSLYMLAKDEEFLENVSELAKKGKKKVSDLVDDFAQDSQHTEEVLVAKIMEKAKQAKEELEHKVSEIAASVYEKMHIANTAETTRLSLEIEKLKTELMLAEARIVHLEGQSL